MKSSNTQLLIGVLLAGLMFMGAGHLWLKHHAPELQLTLPSEHTELQQVPQAHPAADELAYIDRVLHILSAWDKDSLKPLLAPQTLAGSSDAQLAQVLDTLGMRLGALRSYATPASEARVPVVGEPDNLTAYRLVAYYDRGTADVSLILQEDHDRHQLYAFNIEIPQQL